MTSVAICSFKRSFLEETWISITLQQAPFSQPCVGLSGTEVTGCCCVCVCGYVFKLYTHLLQHLPDNKRLASGADVTDVVCILGDWTQRALVCASSLFLQTRAQPRIAADPLAVVWPAWLTWYCSWATSGIAELSWRLLLYSLCCFRHYLWLTWRNSIAIFQGEAVVLCWISKLSLGPERQRLGKLCLFRL